MDLALPSESIDYLFRSTFANTRANMETLSGSVLGQAIDQYQNGKYTQAVRSFKQAIALAPSSGNAFDALRYLGQTYLKLEDSEKAVQACQDGIRLYPTDDTFYKALADIYLKEEKWADATRMYEQAIAINPNDAETQYSLGQCYLEAKAFDRALDKFRQVLRISPGNASGYYGLGQTARAEGDLPRAVDWLLKAERVDKKFALAWRELGYAYADQGDFFRAEEQLSVLAAHGSAYAADLESYMAQATPGKIAATFSPDGFRSRLGPKTEVARLSGKLARPGASQLFSLTFAFSKTMDESSVIDSDNWTLSRATLRENRGVYNNGAPPGPAEATLDRRPAYILFDQKTNMAAVYFRIFQNASADATIDPSHIVFKCAAADAYGKPLDPDADEYAGFSGIA
jgi:Tfp pilus assembly protein PilF